MEPKGFKEISMYLLTLAVAVYFFLIFGGALEGKVDIWSLMAGGLMLFLILALRVDPLFSKLIYGDFKEKTVISVSLGVASALLLYLVFFVGNLVLKKVFPQSLDHLRAIYNLKFGSSDLRIGLFLGLIIGPGEELLWRGWLQRHWSARLGPWPGLVSVAVLYAAVHLSSKNLVLVLAALVCGLWWGYQYLRFKSILANVVSHVLWDFLVFIILPFA